MAFGSMICCGKGFDRKEKGKKQPTWRVFSLKELHAATNNFNYDNKLGEGGFGSVYWGQLWDGSQVEEFYQAIHVVEQYGGTWEKACEHSTSSWIIGKNL